MAVLLSLLLVFSTVAPAAAASFGGNAWGGPPDDSAGDERKGSGQKTGNGTDEKGSNGKQNLNGDNGKQGDEKGRNASEKAGKNGNVGHGKPGKKGESRGNGKKSNNGKAEHPGRGSDNAGGTPTKGGKNERRKNGQDRGNGKPDCGPSTESRNDRNHTSIANAGSPDNCGKKPVFDGEAYVDTDLSALRLRLIAWGLIDSANVSSKWNEGTIDEADRADLRNRLNETFAYYVGRNRTNDSRVMKADHEVAARTGRRLPNVSAHLVVANRKLAETAIADAESVSDALEARNESFDESEVHDHIRKANAALAQAEHVRNASPKSTSAIVHYRRAWSHAQHALDVMDAATEPDVTLDRRDPRHDGPINYTVRGRVFDVRAYQLDEVTVIVNGESRTVPAEVKNVTPGTSAAFAADIRLDSSVNNITVVVSDSGEQLSNLSNQFEPNTVTATLKLDADGLPDRYERNTTTTDPLDSDSDAAGTERNESDDGVSDFKGDLDVDALSTGQEFELGTDPLANDTDDDRLRDAFEVLATGTNPLVNDTDDDGTTDDLEDIDGDGLTNYREQQANSDPTRNDTDGDSIADPDELTNATDPANPDTDDDGLTDFEEPQRPFETDPLQPDTDDDGVLDGDETYTTSTHNESVGATVTITGRGNAAGDVTVRNESSAGFDEGFLADASKSAVTAIRSERHPSGETTVSSRTTRTTSSGTAKLASFRGKTSSSPMSVTLAYDESAVSDESNLATFVYSEDQQRFVELPSTVNEDENTVTARTDRSGRFVVMSTAEWSSKFRENVSEYSVEKDTFDDPSAECDGICTSDGDSVSVGVTRGRTTAGLLSIDGALADERDSVVANGTKYRNGPVSYSDDGSPDAFSIASVETQTDDWSGMTFATRSLGHASDIDFYGDLSAYALPNSTARVVVVDDGRKDTIYRLSAGDTKRSVSHRSIREDLSEYAGETVKFRLEIKGQGGGLHIHGWEVVEDTDGDGVADEADLCTSTAGYQDNGCPPSSLSVLDLNFDYDVEKIRIEADVSSVVETSGSRVVFEREGPPSDEVGRNPSNLQTLYEHDATGRKSTSVTDTARDLEAGETVTLRIRAKGTALIQLDSIDVKIDRDGDGIWDRVERQCLETQRFGCVNTSISKADTDGDGVPDGKEVGERNVDFVGGERNVYFRLKSHPNETDTDEDSLDDGTESGTWEVDVVRDGSGEPYKYDAEGETGEEMDVSSNPLWEDTDDDGATDSVEKRELKTDPEKEITYGITETHQEEIVETLADEYGSAHTRGEKRSIVRTVRALGILDGRSIGHLYELELNDTNDDFDFVRADDGDIVFTALDGNKRADTWLSNRKEADQGLGAWDPDTDDDGLTDGQEAKWMTATVGDTGALEDVTYSSLNEKEGLLGTDHSFPTEPDEADSDGDDSWDGWIGVYETQDSRNVILYREHLRDDDDGDGLTVDDGDTDGGIDSTEAVPAQTGVHGSNPEHSNIHIGELYWGTNPVKKGETPSPSFTFEMDFYEGANNTLYSKQNGNIQSDWVNRIEKNYALYGIDVNIEIDEEVTDDELPEYTIGGVGYEVEAPFSLTDSVLTARKHQDLSDAQYIFVADRSDFPTSSEWPEQIGLGGKKQSGINLYVTGNYVDKLLPVGVSPQGIFVFADRYQNEKKVRKTAVHEIGHSFQIGEADDSCRRNPSKFGEVYSGDDRGVQDLTPELYGGTELWSVMAPGWQNDLTKQPMNGDYFAFSIEELFTTKMDSDAPCYD